MQELQKSPLIAQYFSVKEEYKDSILMFQAGNFFRMMYHDAIVASEALGLKVITKAAGNGMYVPMCGVPVNAGDKHAKALSEKGYKVAICKQAEGKSEVEGVVNRQITAVIAPKADHIELCVSWDNYLETNTFDEKPEPPTAAMITDRPPENANLIKELTDLDLNNMSPMQALNMLNDLKRKYCRSDRLREDL